jgi:S1-C subfamily serine protease
MPAHAPEDGREDGPGNGSGEPSAGLARAAAAMSPAAASPVGGAPRPAPARANGPGTVPYHVALRAPRSSDLRLEIHIERAPQQPRTALALARSMRHGASLVVTEVVTERIHGQRWQRTRFTHATDDGLMAGIEYAALAGPYLYRVGAYGPPGPASRLAGRVAPTLRLHAAAGPTLAAGAVVAVVAADLDVAPGQPVTITPAAMGSGVVADAEGRVLTSLHTLHDQGRDALHDLFVIGRQHPTHGLIFVCAGRPGRGQMDRALDLALIRCELDMSGDALAPSGWPALALGPAPDVGARLWVLGYADADDGALRARPGQALGPSQPGAGPEQGLAIDVPITPGMSGGAVVDERGTLVGIVQGFRDRFEASSAGIRGIGRIGLVRWAQQARPLLEAPPLDAR